MLPVVQGAVLLIHTAVDVFLRFRHLLAIVRVHNFVGEIKRVLDFTVSFRSSVVIVVLLRTYDTNLLADPLDEVRSVNDKTVQNVTVETQLCLIVPLELTLCV